MSGHSKWSTIKHKKAKEDSKRGKIFTKLIKEITVAARLGGGDPTSNARLRLLVEKAKAENMPQDNTIRAIKKGTGELPGVQYEEIMYEGYGPYGTAIIIETLTDNKNRAVSELRRLFSSHGGTLGETGSVGWMFNHLGVVKVAGTMSEDELLEKLLDYDIKDIKRSDESDLLFVYCDPKVLETIKKAVVAKGLTMEGAELEWVPKDAIALPANQEEKAYEFMSLLDDHEDVKNVYTNLA
jgi:YebC/PmpR family DNA-binding regulatory protein